MRLSRRAAGGPGIAMRIPETGAVLRAGYRRFASIRAGLFLGSFAAAKLTAYAIPLLIAAAASPRIYGALELAQSAGLLIALLIAGAPLSGANQSYLVRGERGVGDQFALMGLIGCAAGLLALAVAGLLGLAPTSLLLIAFIGVAIIHTVGSYFFRMIGWRSWAAWADGFSTLAAGLVFLAVLLLGHGVGLAGMIAGFALVAAIGASAAGLWLARTYRTGLLRRLRASTAQGLPMMIVGILAIWLTVEGRIIIGLVNATQLAAYGVAFRVAGLAMGVHQLVATAFFVRLYASRTRAADRLIAMNLAAVGAVGAGIALIGPFLPQWFEMSALEAGGAGPFAAALPLVVLYIFYWSGYAMLQLRINRNGLATRTIAPTVAVTLIGAIAIIAFAKLVTNDLQPICWLLAAHAASYFFKNVIILARHRLPHRSTTATGAIGGALLFLLALVMG